MRHHCSSWELCFLISVTSQSWKRDSLDAPGLLSVLGKEDLFLNKTVSWPSCSGRGRQIVVFSFTLRCCHTGLVTAKLAYGHTTRFPEAWLISKAVLPKGSLFAWARMVQGRQAQILKPVSHLQAAGCQPGSLFLREKGGPILGSKGQESLTTSPSRIPQPGSSGPWSPWRGSSWWCWCHEIQAAEEIGNQVNVGLVGPACADQSGPI